MNSLESFDLPAKKCPNCKHWRDLPEDEHPQLFSGEGVCWYEKFRGDIVSPHDCCICWESADV